MVRISFNLTAANKDVSLQMMSWCLVASSGGGFNDLYTRHYRGRAGRSAGQWASRQYVMVPGTKRKRMKTTIRWFQGFSDLMLMNLMKYYLTWHSKNKTLYCCRWEEKMANRPGQGIAQQWNIVQVWLQMGYIQFGPYSFVFKFKFLYLPMTCHNVYFSK